MTKLLKIEASGFEFESSCGKRRYIVFFNEDIRPRPGGRGTGGRPVGKLIDVRDGDRPKALWGTTPKSWILLSSLELNYDLRESLCAGEKLPASVTPRKSRKPAPSTQIALRQPDPEPVTSLKGLHRDLDVARDAGRNPPSEIRTLIKRMLREGSLRNASAESIASGPAAKSVLEKCPIYNGGHRMCTVYYLTNEARRLVLLRLNTPKAKEVRTRVHERVAQGIQPVAAPATFDVNGIVTAVTAGVTAALAPLFARLRHPNQLEQIIRTTPPGACTETPAGAWVAKEPVGYKTQREMAKLFRLPTEGVAASLVGDVARAIGIYNHSSFTMKTSIVGHGRELNNKHVLYNERAANVLWNGLLAAHKTMWDLGYDTKMGLMKPYMETPGRSRTFVRDRMFDAAVAAIGEVSR